jgi:diguanylate cyclase (GGDEF)-like protein
VGLSRLKQAIEDRKVELSHSAAGFALGLAFCGSSLLIDMQVRDWRGVDGSLYATFTSSLMHSLALLSPIVVGRIFWSLGKHERMLREKLMQLSHTEVMLREQAHHDALTGLYNRAHLAKALEEGIATRSWARRGALLYMLDLDDFKHVNDTFGHRAGDLVLVEIARRLQAVAGQDDLAVRLGGDEFILVHFPGPDELFPEMFAEALIASVGLPIEIDQIVIEPGTSIGIARVAHDGSTWSDVIRAADIALYEAKAEIDSSYCLFRPSMRDERDRQAIFEDEMRRGIEAGEFELHYQPIYGTESGAVRSFEALVRWNHPERGLIQPLDFIPFAETTGLIARLGRVLMMDACRTAATWPKPVGVALNLSPLQFKDPHIVEHVAEALRSSGLAPGRLDLEVTESVMLEASPRVRHVMEGLRALGVRITIDDFGSGFSSLNNLRRFQFDRLKIDRSYTRELGTNGEDAEIVRTIARLSRCLRMETVLEGVETAGQLAFARSEGLTEVQGFYYSKPMTKAAVDEHFAERKDEEAKDMGRAASAA